jgi:hypothetical protein
MTFTEAAIEVLRLTGKPLHYKKITELAIQKNLLSHVGKTPEVTMSSRLATLVKKEAADSLVIKVKPGVFGLRDFGREVIEAAAAELPDDPSAAAEEESLEVAEVVEPGEEAGEAAEAVEGADAAAPAEAAAAPAKKASKPLPGSDVFPEEEDDDEPILGGLDKDEKQGPGGDKSLAGDGGRRRRRRRRRGGVDGVEGGPEPVRAESPAERPARVERPDRGERPARADRPDRGERPDRIDRPDRAERPDRLDRGPREDRLREEPMRGDPNREHADGELVGKDLADAVYAVVSALDRQPQPLARVAEQLVRRGRLAGDPVMLIPTIAAAIRADIARREAETVRPRFRMTLGRVTLTDWSLPSEAVRFEQDAVRAADRQREQVRQAFLRRVRELPGAGFAELLATWLNVEGVVALRAVRRPGAQPGELHLAGTLKRGHDETRLAIVARRDGREIGRERVIEVRGSLHHYGSASAGWLITTGQVLSGAREEAAVPGTAPVACFDGVGLARAMERLGVGLRRHVVPLTTLDLDLLDTLQGNAPASRVEERPRDDVRREGREPGREPRDVRDGGPREPRDGGRRDRHSRREEREARELAQGETQVADATDRVPGTPEEEEARAAALAAAAAAGDPADAGAPPDDLRERETQPDLATVAREADLDEGDDDDDDDEPLLPAAASDDAEEADDDDDETPGDPDESDGDADDADADDGDDDDDDDDDDAEEEPPV